MNDSNKNVLLICWSFPPNPGIGGRRWAKFAKYLQLAGYNLHIIKSTNSTNEVSTWAGDVNQGKLQVYEIEPHRYVRWLKGGPSLVQKLQHRIAKFALSKISKGTIYDASIGTQTQVINLVQEIIEKNNIRKVIATGAPFNLLYYTAKAIEKYQNIISVADYRDPWLDAENYGMKNLDPARKKFEEEKQNKVIENFTFITAPNAFMLVQIRNTFNGNQTKVGRFVELPHAFDIDNFKGLLNPKSIKKEKNILKIVYGGAMYIGIDSYADNLARAISQFNQQSESIKIEADFYTDTCGNYNNRFNGINIKPSVNKGFMDILHAADVLVVMNAEHNKDYKTTKFFEYLPLKKPLLYIGPEGFVSKSIEEEKTGFVFRPDDSLASIISGLTNYTPTENIEKHSFKERTNELIQLLDSSSHV